MTKMTIMTLFLFAFTSCALKPPNDPICFTDSPQHANCAYPMSGGDFEVDNQGHQFKDHNRNWNYDQLIQNSLIMPPDSYADLKNFELNYCHQNPGVCNYSQLLKSLKSVELKLKREQ